MQYNVPVGKEVLHNMMVVIRGRERATDPCAICGWNDRNRRMEYA